jgi:hypothetical protein
MSDCGNKPTINVTAALCCLFLCILRCFVDGTPLCLSADLQVTLALPRLICTPNFTARYAEAVYRPYTANGTDRPAVTSFDVPQNTFYVSFYSYCLH